MSQSNRLHNYRNLSKTTSAVSLIKVAGNAMNAFPPFPPSIIDTERTISLKVLSTDTICTEKTTIERGKQSI